MLAAALLAAPPVHAQNPLAPIWTGMYAGFHGGGNWAEEAVTFDGGPLGSFSDSAFHFGGHLGFNVGLGLAVVGVEADIGTDTFSGSWNGTAFGFAATGKSEVKASGTARARIGIPVGPALLYATAGYAWADVTGKFEVAGFGSGKGSAAIDGIVYGLGAEMKVLPRVSVRVEALRFDYATLRFDLSAIGVGLTKIETDANVVRAGISFAFN